MRNLIFLSIISVWTLTFANLVTGGVPHCSQGWSYHQKSRKCYLQSTVVRSWGASRKFCQQYRGDLATIRNEDENTFVTNMAKTSPRYYWIGLNDIKKEGSWRWLDEQSQVTFKNWKRGDPNNRGNEDCAFITRQYNWQDRQCRISMGSFCERPADIQLCPQGWVHHVGSDKCYRLIATGRSWKNSRKFCQEAGGNLATIRNEDENAFVTKIVKATPRHYWIGLNDIEKEGRWRWLDDPTQVTFTNWRKGEPNNYGNEDCVFITRMYDWQDLYCWPKFPSICERQPDMPRCPQGWSYFEKNHMCYLQSTTDRSWYSSRTFCQQFGGDLVTIRNEDENTFVNNMAKTSPRNYWIALNDIRRQGKWRWSLGKTQVTFTNWKAGEPRNDRDELCVVITAEYSWEPGNCRDKMASFCERLADMKI